jgi:uncharacterized protein (DUF1697 family)
MAELKKLFVRLGYEDVMTFINSGNVIFSSDKTDIESITSDTETALKKKFGFEIAVMIISDSELKEILRKEPFKTTDNEDKNYTKYLAFLKDTPNSELKKNFISLFGKKEKIQIKGNIIYALIYRVDNPKPLFTNMIIEKKLKTLSTTRNINTINKILILTEKLSQSE